MSNLVQKPITDKNGVTSRRWVKSDSGSSDKKSLPAPGIGDSKLTVQQSAPIFQMIHAQSQLGHTLVGLESFEPRAVQAIEELLTKAEEIRGQTFTVTRALNDALKDVSDNIFSPDGDYDDADSSVYEPLNNLAVFGDVVYHPDAVMPSDIVLVNGLKYQFPLISDYLLEADEEETLQARALVTVAGRIAASFLTTEYDGDPEDDFDSYREDSDPRKDKTFITSPELRSYIVSNPEKAEDIAKVVNERNTDDVSVIRGVLEHGQKSLREGWL